MTSFEIAEAIYNIESNFPSCSYKGKMFRVEENNYNCGFESSEDLMCWYVWEDGFVKIVPQMSLRVNQIEKILDAQPWMFI